MRNERMTFVILFKVRFVLPFRQLTEVEGGDTYFNHPPLSPFKGGKKFISSFYILHSSFYILNYKGIFPCFFIGKVSAFFSNILKPAINLALVSSGRMTSSTIPRSAAR